jgi:hypothetical protein
VRSSSETIFCSDKKNRLAVKFNVSFTHKVSVLCHFCITVYYSELFTKCKYLQNYQILSYTQFFCAKNKEKTLTKSYSFDLVFFLSFLPINYLLIRHKVSAQNIVLFTNCKEIHSTCNYLQSVKKYTLLGKNDRLALKSNASFTHKVSVLSHCCITVCYLELFTKCKYLQNYQTLSHL